MTVVKNVSKFFQTFKILTRIVSITDVFYFYLVDPEIEDIWKQIDYQIKSNATNQPAEHKFDAEVTRRFRVIRVFVSSTFTDFFNEREVLVKQVTRDSLNYHTNCCK